jgi:pyruvate/2-oxoglutarate dehydrogenase complex dihydrolipoamide dehydrogenase (E3) component
VARTGAAYGVQVEAPVRVDMAFVKKRKDAVVRASNEGVTKELKDAPNLTVIEGQGRFEGSHSVRVNGVTLEAPQIFINVGARALVPA